MPEGSRERSAGLCVLCGQPFAVGSTMWGVRNGYSHPDCCRARGIKLRTPEEVMRHG